MIMIRLRHGLLAGLDRRPGPLRPDQAHAEVLKQHVYIYIYIYIYICIQIHTRYIYIYI